MSSFDTQSLANTSWAFSRLTFRNTPLLDALSAAALPSIDAGNLQGLVRLVDAGLPGSGALEPRLREALVPRVLGALPRSAAPDEVHRYGRHLESLLVHDFGVAGTRLLLDHMEVGAAPTPFQARAACEIAAAPHSARVSGYMEYRLVAQDGRVIFGRLTAQSGGAAPWTTAETMQWLRPTPLPSVAAGVDRAQCAEFRLLAQLAARASAAGLLREPGSVQGTLWLSVTAAPCASCVGVVQQLKTLLPAVRFGVAFGA